MKKIILHFITIVSITSALCYGTEKTRFISEKITSKKIMSRTKLYLVLDQQLYTTGGVTFTYPSCIFTNPPTVQVSIEPNPLNPNSNFLVEVISNNTQETVIMVYVAEYTGESIVVTEAPAESVFVYLNAQENERA